DARWPTGVEGFGTGLVADLAIGWVAGPRAGVFENGPRSRYERLTKPFQKPDEPAGDYRTPVRLLGATGNRSAGEGPEGWSTKPGQDRRRQGTSGGTVRGGRRGGSRRWRRGRRAGSGRG